MISNKISNGLNGNPIIPGDKSISHRTIMLAALSDQRSKVNNLSNGKDINSAAVPKALPMSLYPPWAVQIQTFFPIYSLLKF